MGLIATPCPRMRIMDKIKHTQEGQFCELRTKSNMLKQINYVNALPEAHKKICSIRSEHHRKLTHDQHYVFET